MDLNGYNISVSGSNDITLGSNKTLTVTDSTSQPGTIRLDGSSWQLFWLYGSAHLIIENGNFIHNRSGGGGGIFRATDATAIVDINGGNFDSSLLDTDDQPTEQPTVNIYGGSFSQDVSSLVAEGYECNQAGDRYVVTKAPIAPRHPPIKAMI